MKKITLILLYLISSYAIAQSEHIPVDYIEPFSTDGCSVAPAGTPSDNTAWVHCCIEHDISYWIGGRKTTRLKTDRKLRACIREAGYSIFGALYYAAVRKAGSPWINSPWRWGYGWPYKHGYRRLNSAQRGSVERESKYITEVIEEYMRRFSLEIRVKKNYRQQVLPSN